MKKMDVAYLRVSTEAQTEKYGLDMQKQKILDYCERKGVAIDKWYIDGGYSGSKLDRPEIQKLLDDAENGLIKTVYIYKLDRLSRDTADTLELMYRILPKFGAKVVSMTEEIRTDSPMDKVMLTMNAAMNQYEREIIRMRMSAGMIERVKKGLWPGGGNIPWGYYYDRNDGILHVDEKQAEQVRNAYRLYLDGYSCEKISKMLGFKGERIVIQILKRKSNIGLIEYKGNVYKGLHEPIVDETLFWAVQESMKKRSTNSYVANDHLLTGLCYCGICGARMRYQKWGKYHKIICYSQYNHKEYMRKSNHCTNKKIKADFVEKEVEDCFRVFAVDISDKKVQWIDKSKMISQTISAAKNKIKKMYAVYFEHQSDNLLEMINEEENKVKQLENELLEERKRAKTSGSDAVDKIKRISDVWDSLERREKNKALKECVEKVVITGDDIDIYFRTFL